MKSFPLGNCLRRFQKAEEQSKITTLWIEKHKPQKAKLEEQFRKFLRAEGLDDTAESFNEWVVRLSPAQTLKLLTDPQFP